MYVFMYVYTPGGEEMYGGVGFRGGSGGGQGDEGREQGGAETKTLQQEGQRLVSGLRQNSQMPSQLHCALFKLQRVCVWQSCAGR